MKLIVESGSTKTDWKVKNSDGIILSESSAGINPILQSLEEIKEEQDCILKKCKKFQIKSVEYYGAGCVNEISGSKIKSLLSHYFIGASIQVDSDLVAACRALFDDESGIVCILGTGSNSALFEKGKIIDRVKSLGYLMGDEGSGSQIGRVLIRDYFRRRIPSEINEFMANYFGKPHDELLKDIYELKYPNRFFAQLVKDIISENIKSSYVNDLVENQIHLFFYNCLLKYKNIHEHKIGFIGSISFHFQDILINLASNYRISVQSIIKRPIDRLVLIDN